MNYQLLKTFSRQPIQFGRFLARLLAGLVNTLKITRTSKSKKRQKYYK
ncbi:putative lipid A biosynthesis lauroyl acyltransferase domain protein [Acinetobacter baumannii 45057_1]|nr:putative lipid A biosynthesis lauroyl acyltransferase domain protein [Acinetobacter baumannii 42057_5]KCZ33345.1 putative lipid A biosynthesis lauroyl acyltransferase domain protein [Acinetobacter baumannii 45057_1]